MLLRRVAVTLMVTGLLGVAAWARQSSSPRYLVVQNYSFARPGLADSVYRMRLRAREVRAGLGLVVGRVLRRGQGGDSLPDVIWEAEYPDSEARVRDLVLLGESAEFAAIAETMETLLRRFDRASWWVEGELPEGR